MCLKQSKRIIDNIITELASSSNTSVPSIYLIVRSIFLVSYCISTNAEITKLFHNNKQYYLLLVIALFFKY